MSVAEPQPAAPKGIIRWFHLTPGRFVLALLFIEALLWLSDRFGWWHKGYAVLTAVAAVGVAMLLLLAWFGVAVVCRRRFQFSICWLLVLFVVVALPCSWLAVEMSNAERQRQAVTEPFVSMELALGGTPVPNDDPLAWLLGRDFFHSETDVYLFHARRVAMLWKPLPNCKIERLPAAAGARRPFDHEPASVITRTDAAARHR